MRLRAKPFMCEEAHTSSHDFYIPCNKSAIVLVKTSDSYVYRMCMMCADHNTRNRGAKLLGPYTPKYQQAANNGLEEIP